MKSNQNYAGNELWYYWHIIQVWSISAALQWQPLLGKTSVHIVCSDLIVNMLHVYHQLTIRLGINHFVAIWSRTLCTSLQPPIRVQTCEWEPQQWFYIAAVFSAWRCGGGGGGEGRGAACHAQHTLAFSYPIVFVGLLCQRHLYMSTNRCILCNELQMQRLCSRCRCSKKFFDFDTLSP